MGRNGGSPLDSTNYEQWEGGPGTKGNPHGSNTATALVSGLGAMHQPGNQYQSLVFRLGTGMSLLKQKIPIERSAGLGGTLGPLSPEKLLESKGHDRSQELEACLRSNLVL